MAKWEQMCSQDQRLCGKPETKRVEDVIAAMPMVLKRNAEQLRVSVISTCPHSLGHIVSGNMVSFFLPCL